MIGPWSARGWQRLALCFVLVALGIVSAGCGKGESDRSDQQNQSGGNYDDLSFEQPMMATMGGNSPPGANGSSRVTLSLFDTMDSPEVPGELQAPESGRTITFSPVDESTQSYNVVAVRKLTESGSEYIRRDHFEIDSTFYASDDDDLTRLELQTTRVLLNFTSPGAESEYDTINAIAYTGALANSLAPVLQTIIDDPIELQLDAVGDVKQMTLPEPFLTAVQNDERVEQYGTGEDLVKEIVHQLIVPFSDKPMAVGDQWTRTPSFSRYGSSIEMSAVYTFEGLAELDEVECAVISFEITAQGPGLDTTIFTQMSYLQSGVAYVDASTGQLIQAVSEAEGSTILENEEGELEYGIAFRTRVTRS